VRMKIDLVCPSRPRIVRNFVFENDVDTIVHVSANDQRKLLPEFAVAGLSVIGSVME
jgi:hypothetical protein